MHKRTQGSSLQSKQLPKIWSMQIYELGAVSAPLNRTFTTGKGRSSRNILASQVKKLGYRLKKRVPP